MPGRNGTGPEGEGPLTGRGLGPCGSTGTEQEGEALPVGRGRGLWGRGLRLGLGGLFGQREPTTEAGVQAPIGRGRGRGWGRRGR